MADFSQIAACALAAVVALAPAACAGWRSSLYPDDWTPGYTDAEGRFLHDISYAGYHRAEAPLPDCAELPVINVVEAPYGADPTGAADSTAAIQRALDAARDQGGAVVFLPAGTFRVAPPTDGDTALRIRGSHIVLRGAGRGKTFLFNDSTEMRSKNMILLSLDTPMDWRAEGEGILASSLSESADNRAKTLRVQSARGFAVGDMVAVRADLTARFIESVGMTGHWPVLGAKADNILPIFLRRIAAVDVGAGTVTLDVPLRYPMLVEDNARVVKLPGRPIEECGIEDLSIGMRQQMRTGFEEMDYADPAKAAYQSAFSIALLVVGAENCWVRRVATYAPEGNDPYVHLLSNGIRLRRSRFVTVSECDLRHTQYKGGGGNGYTYTLQGQECLVVDSHAEDARHNYDFGTMSSSGNVILRCRSDHGYLASDFHMYLSMANLIDSQTCHGDSIEARAIRPWGAPAIHGVTTTQSVFWNTRGLGYPPARPFVVYSHQFGDGYVIGTSGPACAVDSSDFVEGEGTGEALEPQSLFLDQLKRRTGGSLPMPSPPRK
jgi:hypothetical protein